MLAGNRTFSRCDCLIVLQSKKLKTQLFFPTVGVRMIQITVYKRADAIMTHTI